MKVLTFVKISVFVCRELSWEWIHYWSIYGVDLLKLVEKTARSGEEKRGVLMRELEAAGIFDTMMRLLRP